MFFCILFNYTIYKYTRILAACSLRASCHLGGGGAAGTQVARVHSQRLHNTMLAGRWPLQQQQQGLREWRNRPSLKGHNCQAAGRAFSVYNQPPALQPSNPPPAHAVSLSLKWMQEAAWPRCVHAVPCSPEPYGLPLLAVPLAGRQSPDVCIALQPALTCSPIDSRCPPQPEELILLLQC